MVHLFDPRPQPVLPVVGCDDTYPVGRIFCVGRNYVDHATEMGGTVDRAAPFYFTKSAHHLAVGPAHVPFPKGTQDYHHEIELVVALDKPLSNAEPENTVAAIFGYAVGLDMTRRDLQAAAKDKRRPWDTGKDVEDSAVIGPLTRAAKMTELGPQRIALEVDGEIRQDATLDLMVWQVPELLAHLSTLYELAAGDVIMMGTPAGVGAVGPGAVLIGTIDGLEPLHLTLDPR